MAATTVNAELLIKIEHCDGGRECTVRVTASAFSHSSLVIGASCGSSNSVDDEGAMFASGPRGFSTTVETLAIFVYMLMSELVLPPPPPPPPLTPDHGPQQPLLHLNLLRTHPKEPGTKQHALVTSDPD